jgi:hypothetical protein
MKGNTIHIGQNVFHRTVKAVSGEFCQIENEDFYKISNYEEMTPFFMNIVSDSDLWMFVSSNGALTAGRKNPDQALFPYYTDDRIHDSKDITGSKTILFITKDEKSFLWEPFSSRYEGLYNIEKSIYKNTAGNKLIFEESNIDLSVSFRYSWMNCDRFGFVRKSRIVNDCTGSVFINVLDGIQNILPYGADRKFQLEYSTLLDGYKKNELLEEIGLGLFTLSSIPTDKAEPSEALRTTIAWSVGLENAAVLLSSKQLNSFRNGNRVIQETNVKASRGAYFLQAEFKLAKSDFKEWYIVADVNKDQSDVAALSSLLLSKKESLRQIENEIIKSTTELNLKVANADGFQLTNDMLNTSRHFSNVLFNIMRGGILDENYLVKKIDFSSFIHSANKRLSEKYQDFLNQLPDQLNISELIDRIKKLEDPDFQKLVYEYLPLTFSRRHGDPSRPWNLFSIDIKNEYGEKILNYQGNWRDIFQNWEALAISFPGFIENMIVKFVNASTADGYNPYRVTRDGFEWEELEPSDAWSYIGYWGDHQIVYLLKLLELSAHYHPGILESFLTKDIFAYANVPYKIKPYEAILADSHNTIDFDFDLNSEIKKRVEALGLDGKYIWDDKEEIYHVNLTEKLLLSALVKLSNFIPEAGIWMNTQRPEWNDANNALVGFGASMVTLYQLRKFTVFCIDLFGKANVDQIDISDEVLELFTSINHALVEFRNLLISNISDSNRKQILDELGQAGSVHRLKIYSNGFSGEKKQISVFQIILFFQLVLDYVDHSIKANKRDDDLYHSYNLVKINDRGEIGVRHLYEMLEGQVAILNSGYLSVEDSIVLLSSLRKSSLYRKDQSSYLLYPDRCLSNFTEKNIIPKELFEQSQFLKNLVDQNDKSLVVRDVDGNVHFNSKFRNVAYLKQVLNERKNSHNPSSDEEEQILEIYESVFDHQSFTGRSGTFYKYEGLGCIYWHMVSKLLLAVQETFLNAVETCANESTVEKLKKYYCEIREGIGSHKHPELYGAFPTDPYSHTPKNMGAQQPGMTGQVKEDIISRFGELGLFVRDGKINFNPILLDETEFLTKSKVYQYYNVNGKYQTLMLNPGMLAYTFCQIPIVYIMSKEQKIILTKKSGIEEEIDGSVIGTVLSKMIFQREGEVLEIKILTNKINTY